MKRLVFIALLAAITVTAAATLAQTDGVSLQDLDQSYVSLADRVMPSVVQVVSTGYGPLYDRGYLSAIFTKRQSSGSGVVVDTGGFILTNAHVVAGAKRIQVVLHTESAEGSPGNSILRSVGKVVGAQLVGLDIESDLALLKIQEIGLTPISFGNSDDLRPGSVVLAFGSPLGLQNSVTLGVVSNVARQLSDEDPMIYIQTDAPINPGNSGGPLVDSRGRLVGINTFIISQSGGNEGIGFAAPSNIVRTVYEQLREFGYVRRGEIGVHAQTITPTMAEALGLSRNWGVIIGDVAPGSPAEKAGLRIGDVILRMGGKVMENARQFDVNVYRRQVGEAVALEVLTDGDPRTVKIPVVERPDTPDRFASRVSTERNLIPELGVMGLEVDDQIVRLLEDEPRKPGGIIVAALSAEAVYLGDGLLPGDIIYSMNGEIVRDLEDLRQRTDSLRIGDPVLLQIERDGRLHYVAFDIQ
ncbi:PDZ domain-containing protein [candidate division GN15 bacterium]|nr:PDZ domain-containing protein [candidate division GN15 bacterium]